MPASTIAPTAAGAGTIARRDDSLVSVAIIANGTVESVQEAARRASDFLESRFDFFELVVLVPASVFEQNEAAFDDLLKLRNLRCLILRDGTGEYRAAVLAATETIGDIVLIVLADESPVLDLGTLYDTAAAGGGSVMLRHLRRAGPVSEAAGRLLSVISGYDVDPRLLRSAAHPRAQIGRIASRADREIALRFMPLGGRRPSELTVLEIDDTSALSHNVPILRRIGLAIEVMSNSPPHLLRIFAATSFLVTIGATLYFFYAITLFAIGAELQAGWLTTSLAISGSTAFISVALGGISTALYQILNLLRDDTGDEILRELDNTDLFREFRRVNVETLNAE